MRMQLDIYCFAKRIIQKLIRGDFANLQSTKCFTRAVTNTPPSCNGYLDIWKMNIFKHREDFIFIMGQMSGLEMKEIVFFAISHHSIVSAHNACIATEAYYTIALYICQAF